MRPTKIEWAMMVAKATALRSTCCRRAVGCVLLDEDGHILSTGYNGVAAGLPHCNEPLHVVHPTGPVTVDYPYACDGAQAQSGTFLEQCEAVHAEQNALLQCADVRRIATCVVTTSPCMSCLKLFLNTPCRRIYFADAYPDEGRTARLWMANPGRLWEQLITST